MYKLIILVHGQRDLLMFEEGWPVFLKAAEQMPGLVREATSPIHEGLYGVFVPMMVHELFFETAADLRKGLASAEGQKAAQILQKITEGEVTLLLAEHLEDELANIKALELPKREGPPGDKA